jgi:hypothetical protein
MTFAVIRVLVSSTASFASSTHPIQSSRPARDDLDVFRLVLRLSVEAAPVLSKPGPSRRRRLSPAYCPVLVDEVDVQLDQQALHLGLVLR